MATCKCNEYSVGDKVKIKSYEECLDIGSSPESGGIDTLDKADACDKICTITKICKSGNLKLSLDGTQLQGTFNPEWVDCSCDDNEDDENDEYETYQPIKKINQTKTMDKIITFVKNLTLSSDEKLLREYNIVDSCGDYTIVARELVLQKLVSDNRDYLVQQATAFDADKQAKKKANS